MKIICLLFIIVVISLVASTSATGLNQKLLVVSMDGFRQAYFKDDRFLPWFNSFRQDGVYSDSIISIFPSETFPNHYGIATGMYAESHGVVSNSMYDPKTNTTFRKSDLSSYWWDQAEPIWVTATKQSKKTAISFWPGSAVKFPPNDYTPTYYREVYETKTPLHVRIDETVDHLKNDNVDLAMLYYYQPDKAGHKYGTNSTEVNLQLKLNDWYLSYLLKRLDDVDLGKNKLNIIICSDHGMANITTLVHLEDYLSVEDNVERVNYDGPVYNFQPKAGKLTFVLEALKRATESGSPFVAYQKQLLPAAYHYSNNERIMDVVIVCEIGVSMFTERPGRLRGGDHGYNPKEPQMKPIFMARGPAFKTGGYRARQVFETKDIYAIMAHVVGITPTANNASLELASDIFASSAAWSAAFGINKALSCAASALMVAFLKSI